jgi:hypothetical protein
MNTGAFVYSLDRWRSFSQTSDGAFTVQQDSSAPAGFVNSAKITVTTADASIGANQGYNFQQSIEGTNVSDLVWGTANAKTVTLSFWVRSSLTGTFGGAVRNNDNSRAYPFSYTISSADTWEQKSITIAGDTTGTWLTTTGTGVNLLFSFGAGSDFLTTGGSWNATNRQGVTGQVQLIGTLNATWYVTGVQLEVGSVATPFERRPFGTELALCQRYYYKNLANLSTVRLSISGIVTASTAGQALVQFPVPMRIAPTALEQSGTAGDYSLVNSGGTGTALNAVPEFNISSSYICLINCSVASGLTAGHSTMIRAVNTNAFLGFSAEL